MRNRYESRQCRDQRDKVVALRADFSVLAIIYLIERVVSGIASSFACADAFVVTDTGYRPRNPEDSLLYQVVAGELETFLASQQAQDRTIPKFVEDEFRSFLGDALRLAPHFHSIVICGPSRWPA
jgi:hypothetical protein